MHPRRFLGHYNRKGQNKARWITLGHVKKTHGPGKWQKLILSTNNGEHLSPNAS